VSKSYHGLANLPPKKSPFPGQRTLVGYWNHSGRFGKH